VRYGLQLLPAFAAFFAVVMYIAIGSARNASARMGIAFLAVLLVVGGYIAVWRAQPISYREAWVNSRARIALESELAKQLRLLPPNSTLLMYLGDHVGALQQAGIPLRRTIQEGNHRTWKQPLDPDGLWERALADPARYSDFAVAFAGDPVYQATQKHNLESIVHIHTTGQPEAIIYRTRPTPSVISSVNPAAPKPASAAVLR
jgi:hypothetical protein